MFWDITNDRHTVPVLAHYIFLRAQIDCDRNGTPCDSKEIPTWANNLWAVQRNVLRQSLKNMTRLWAARFMPAFRIARPNGEIVGDRQSNSGSSRRAPGFRTRPSSHQTPCSLPSTCTNCGAFSQHSQHHDVSPHHPRRRAAMRRGRSRDDRFPDPYDTCQMSFG